MLWVMFEGWRNGMDWEGIGWFAFLIIGLFICVVLHELGHSIAAQKYEVTVKDILISPIRGAARMDSLPEQPIAETTIAAAGPFVNLILLMLLGCVGWLTDSLDFSAIGRSKMAFGNPENFVTLFFLINAMLVVFNLIPAFPLDGGRIFRSILSMQFGRRKATMITSYFGQFISISIVILAYYFLPEKIMIYMIPFFGLMSVFLFYTATQEYEMVKTEEILKNHQVAELILREFTTFQKEDNITLAKAMLEEGKETDFLVKNEEGKIVGILKEVDILENTEVVTKEIHLIEKYISPVSENAHPTDSLFQFYKKMKKQELRMLPIFENENLVGVLGYQQLNDFLRVEYNLK